MNPQDYIAAQQAAWGAGTVIENAENFHPKTGDDTYEFLTALTATLTATKRLRSATLLAVVGDVTMSRKEARYLATQMLTNAQEAYRLLRIALGEPMFHDDELAHAPEWVDD